MDWVHGLFQNIKLATNLPSESKSPKLSKEESKDYLKQNPEEFEELLSLLLVQGNAETLKELLPIYQQVPNYDPSVIDWGNAIIATQNGDFDKAVALYRTLNSQLPNVAILRFQMAMALFYNQQFEAAKLEFEKLRSGTESEEDIAVINKYLEAINDTNGEINEFEHNIVYEIKRGNVASAKKHKMNDYVLKDCEKSLVLNRKEVLNSLLQENSAEMYYTQIFKLKETNSYSSSGGFN